MEEPVLIVGSGAVATLFAAHLSAAGATVGMLATWAEAVEALLQRGARAVLPGDRVIGGRVRVSDDPEDFKETRFAVVLVKSWQTDRAAAQLAGVLAEDGVALTLQNGLGNQAALANMLGSERTAAGVVIVGAQMVEPGLVRSTGSAWVHLENKARLAPLADVFRNAGFRVDVHADILPLQWEKLVANAAINPLSAVLGVPNGHLLCNAHAHHLLKDLVQEACAVAEAAGVSLPEDALGRIEEVIRKTAGNRSSMLQDLQRGAQTEIDAITGRLLLVAQEVGVDTPIHHTFYQLVRALAFPNCLPAADEE